MNRPAISITDAISIAIRYSNIENDEPCCVSAVYEDGLFNLIVYTLFQKYEFYLHGTIGEVIGMNSEPCLYPDDNDSFRICA